MVIEKASGALVAVLVALVAVNASAQTLPRVDGALTMSQAVDLALDKSLRVKAASADASTMESMRREAQAPFWPQLSANGYFVNQRMAPNVYTSAGNTMARNYQVFGADQNRDGNFTAMYSLFSGGRDYYTYRAAARRAEAGREMLRGAEVDVAMQARLDYIAAVRETENLQVLADLLGGIEERLRVTRSSSRPAVCRATTSSRRGGARQRRADAGDDAEPDGAGAGGPQDHAGHRPRLGHRVGRAAGIRPRDLSIEEGIREASERHPELKAAIKQREAAEAEVRAAYGNYFPQVSLGYMYDWRGARPKRTEEQ